MNILDLIFPPVCPLCGKLMVAGEGKYHEKCYRKLMWVKEPRCKLCGKPILQMTQVLCLDCMKKGKRSFDQGRSLWLYKDGAAKAVLDFKYKGMKCYTDFFVEALVKTQGRWILEKSPDLLVPVPLHRRKKKKRGFNQAELLAQGVGQRLKIPVCPDCLCRKRWTKPQKTIGRNERRTNLMRAMEIKNLPPGVQTVMLVDDIYTTGSTMEVCAHLLKSAGVRKVFFITLCVGQGE